MLNLNDNLLQGLACAALSPGLRGILVFDASPPIVQLMADTLEAMVSVMGTPPDQVHLSSLEDEDSLWGNRTLTTLIPQHEGLLRNQGETPRIIVIPDLPSLSLAAQRAGITMLDTGQVYLERHGQHEHWNPNVWWLAACPYNQSGDVSAHLLDRFMVRLQYIPLRATRDRSEALYSLLDNEEHPPPKVTLSQSLHTQLSQARYQYPLFEHALLARVIRLFPVQISQRREIALARMSVALARLKGGAAVTPADVDHAATLMGLSVSDDTPPEVPIPTVGDKDVTQPPERLIDPSTLGSLPSLPSSSLYSNREVLAPAEESVFQPDDPQVMGPVTTTLSDPYPEDHAFPNRDAFSLRLPLHRRRAISHPQGHPISVESSHTFHDIAIVPTLLSALWYQAIRGQSDGKLKLSFSDIKTYRRASIAEQMLLLVLDYTCLSDCNWESALLPHLRWAYFERATISLIQVGVAMDGLRHELQAHKIEVQNILVPRLSYALGANSGSATPLAHGFELVVQTLQRVLQHGRSLIQHVRLVVITDGRGNVPIESSHTLSYPVNIKRQGIDDAFQMAKLIRQFKQVQSFVLNPQPKYYGDLPLTIAHLLGADIELIPPLILPENEMV